MHCLPLGAEARCTRLDSLILTSGRGDVVYGHPYGAIYSSVRMLKDPRNIATFCHFLDRFGDYFGWIGCSASSMGIIESEQREGVFRRWQELVAMVTENCHQRSLMLFTMFLVFFSGRSKGEIHVAWGARSERRLSMPGVAGRAARRWTRIIAAWHY